MEFSISGRPIGPAHPPYVVAELSANHGGSLERALALVEAAAECGADAVKFQAYGPETLTIDCQAPPFRLEETIWKGRTLYELYREAHTPWSWLARLQDSARARGLSWFASVFDPGAIALLEGLAAPAYKIASFELVDLPLLECAARTGKPIILSTGMATLEEIDEAVRAIRAAGGRQLALLHCASAYPAPAAEMNLCGLPRLGALFGLPVGLSDHTREPAVAPAAVALGASIIEEHLTLSRSAGGPDAAFSLEPVEFASLVRSVCAAREALGRAEIGPRPSEMPARRLRRSLFVVADVKAGQALSAENVRSIRPAAGLHPRYLRCVLGRPARRDIARGTPLCWEHVG